MFNFFRKRKTPEPENILRRKILDTLPNQRLKDSTFTPSKIAKMIQGDHTIQEVKVELETMHNNGLVTQGNNNTAKEHYYVL